MQTDSLVIHRGRHRAQVINKATFATTPTIFCCFEIFYLPIFFCFCFCISTDKSRPPSDGSDFPRGHQRLDALTATTRSFGVCFQVVSRLDTVLFEVLEHQLSAKCNVFCGRNWQLNVAGISFSPDPETHPSSSAPLLVIKTADSLDLFYNDCSKASFVWWKGSCKQINASVWSVSARTCQKKSDRETIGRGVSMIPRRTPRNALKSKLFKKNKRRPPPRLAALMEPGKTRLRWPWIAHDWQLANGTS